MFNQPVDKLHNSLTYLTFGEMFYQPVDNSPNLTVRLLFNQPVDKLPPYVKIIVHD